MRMSRPSTGVYIIWARPPKCHTLLCFLLETESGEAYIFHKRCLQIFLNHRIKLWTKIVWESSRGQQHSFSEKRLLQSLQRSTGWCQYKEISTTRMHVLSIHNSGPYVLRRSLRVVFQPYLNWNTRTKQMKSHDQFHEFGRMWKKPFSLSEIWSLAYVNCHIFKFREKRSKNYRRELGHFVKSHNI